MKTLKFLVVLALLNSSFTLAADTPPVPPAKSFQTPHLALIDDSLCGEAMSLIKSSMTAEERERLTIEARALEKARDRKIVKQDSIVRGSRILGLRFEDRVMLALASGDVDEVLLVIRTLA